MNPVRDNPIRTRDDFARAAVQMIEPLIPRMSPGKALIDAGTTGALYPDTIAQMEAFSRPLWAIVPMLAGNIAAVEPLWALWKEGIENGVNPAHPEYWGDLAGSDQRMVEMAVMGMGMAIAPDRFFGDLSETARHNLVRWLNQINLYETPKNNWAFFRVLVNIGFIRNGLPHDEKRMAYDLALIDAHYDGDGWYNDYPTQRDYYTPWAFHFYGLVYAKVMEAVQPEQSKTYKQRAGLYAPQFAGWFTADGEALPYGRSLTYRFAQGAFFAAMAFAGMENPALGYGEAKHMLLGNLRTWLDKPIFTGDGLLSIGYGYPNLNMAESYNAPGSPYWAMKAFLALALPEEHPFWQAEEKPYIPPAMQAQPYAGLLVTRDADGAQVQAFAAGNHAPAHEHTDAKYEKFAYSTAFGFSVPRSPRFLRMGAFDSMLALSETGDDGRGNWRVRFGYESHAILSDRTEAIWKLYPDVTVRTVIVPVGNDWHLRIHTVDTPRPLMAAEGGFALLQQREWLEAERQTGDGFACASAPWGLSGIVALVGYAGQEVIVPEPNTNLMHTRTVLPTLYAQVPAGKTQLCCAVLGAVTDMEAKWAKQPKKEAVYAYMGE